MAVDRQMIGEAMPVSAHRSPEQETARPGSVIRDSFCIFIDMVVIPCGSFWMGSPGDEPLRQDTEGPQHLVTLDSFLMGKTAVTQRQWKALMGHNPSQFKVSDDHPVERVSWDDAQAYIARLNRETGHHYGLPSEAQWEYCARAGTTTPFYTGHTLTTGQANFNGRYIYNDSPTGHFHEQTMPVASFAPNAFGLHDMHGNVWEWVEDPWHDHYDGAPTDGKVWQSESGAVSPAPVARVLRGGSWLNAPAWLRSAARVQNPPNIRNFFFGFRLVRPLDPA